MTRKITLTTIFIMATFVLCGQSNIPFKELEQNSEYMELKRDEADILAHIAILEKDIKSKKSLASKEGADIATLTSQIIESEGIVFTLRDKLTATTQKSAIIEQEFLLKHPNAIVATKKSNTTPFQGEVITHPQILNLASSTEKEILKSANKFEKLAKETYSIIAATYNSLREYIAPYAKTGDEIEGKEIQKLFNEGIATIKGYDNSIAKKWEAIYDTKIYLYNRYLDKISAPKSVINHLNIVSRENRSVISEVTPHDISPSLSSYGREEIIIMEYEKQIASLLSAHNAVDSLSKAIKNAKPERYDLKNIELPIQTFITYTPISRLKSKAHTTANPPKELTIPSNGEVHKVQLGIYSKKITNLALLYNISPVEYYKSPKSGKYYYWAGSYKTLKEAQAASTMLNRSKLKTFTSSWKDGKHAKYPSLSKGEYRVEIDVITDQISEKVANSEGGKQIITTTNSQGGKIYYIGIFNNKNEAETFALSLNTTAKVVPCI